MSSKQPSNNKIIQRGSDKIVPDKRITCYIFNDYFCNVATKSGFDYEIHDDFETSAGIVKIIEKHSNQPSIIKI